MIYEVHVKGFSIRNLKVSEHLRGTYAGLTHESSIQYLKELGITAVELLPVHHLRRALLHNPLSFLINLRLTVGLYYDRQYDSALAQMNRAAEMEQHSGSVDFWSSLIYEMRLDPTDAVQSDV